METQTRLSDATLNTLTASELGLAVRVGKADGERLPTHAQTVVKAAGMRFCGQAAEARGGGRGHGRGHGRGRGGWRRVAARGREFAAAFRAACEGEERELSKEALADVMAALGLPPSVHPLLWPEPSDPAAETYRLDVAVPFFQARLETLAPPDLAVVHAAAALRTAAAAVGAPAASDAGGRADAVVSVGGEDVAPAALLTHDALAAFLLSHRINATDDMVALIFDDIVRLNPSLSLRAPPSAVTLAHLLCWLEATGFAVE